MLSKKFFLSILAIIATAAQAGGSAPLFSAQPQALPDLALPSDLPTSRFAIDQQSATLGGDTRDQTWTTHVNYATDPALSVVYGLRLDPTLAGGTNLVYGTRHKELLLNAIYAPQKDLRFKFSGGQLRRTDDFEFASGAYADSVTQHTYLVGVHKYWDSALFSDFSLNAWHAYADDTEPGQQALVRETELAKELYIDPRALATGARRGYLLNLALTPLPESRLELGTGVDQTSYHFADGSASRDDSASHRLHYTQYLDNCSRLQGNYQSKAAWRSFGVSLASGAWSIGAARSFDRDSGDGGYAINAGYTIPMGKTSGRPSSCGSDLNQARTFGSMVNSSVTRSSNLPVAPLVQVDPTARPVLSAVSARDQVQ